MDLCRTDAEACRPLVSGGERKAPVRQQPPIARGAQRTVDEELCSADFATGVERRRGGIKAADVERGRPPARSTQQTSEQKY